MTRPALLSFAADLVFVIAFVLIGRSSHDENPIGGALVTLWPFAAGLVIGWVVSRAWLSPRRIVPSGLVIWVATVAIGMLLRVASNQGIKISFVIVASVVLAIFLLGWRLVASLVLRRKR